MMGGFSLSQMAPNSTFTKNQGLLLSENHHLCLSNFRHQGFGVCALRCCSQLMQKDPAILCVTEQYSLKQWLSLGVFSEFQKVMLKVGWLCTQKDYIPIITSKRMGGEEGMFLISVQKQRKQFLSRFFICFFKLHSAQLLK